MKEPAAHILQSYLFRFTNEPKDAPCQLISLGWQKPEENYYWDGESRKRGEASVSFQFTLSGKGILEIDEQVLPLERHQAFFLAMPGNHTYYLPKTSPHWEFIYVQLAGPIAEATCRMMHDALGRTPSLPPDSSPILYLWEMLRQAQDLRIGNGYIGSKLAYGFLMELQSYLRSSSISTSFPLPIRAAMHFIAEHYSEAIGIQNMANAAGLSKFHFARVFQKAVGHPPVQYLSNFRIQKASELLRTTPLPVCEISTMVGYPNCNYFCKLFKQSVGCTPLEFRRDPADQLIFGLD